MEKVKLGCVIKLKANTRKLNKLDYSNKYIVRKMDDLKQLITQVEDQYSNIINLKMSIEFFEVVWHTDSGIIAKPILEERKIGKVKMHLVDEGFPNAMMELGKMMGWAEEFKGYKPNDFKNLPNAEVEFSAAATRHRLKGFIQKAEGVPAIHRVDEESGISHLCHAAFNILAELELVLTGRIK